MTFFLIVITIFLLYKGLYVNKPGWFTWHMFTYYSLVETDLRDTDENQINIRDYLPHTQLYIPLREFMYLLAYLKKEGTIVSGYVKINENGKSLNYFVKNNVII